MLARRLDPAEVSSSNPPVGPALQRAQGRWRHRGQEPTRGPEGEVRWWERAAPRGDDPMWEAVRRCQARRIAGGIAVVALTRAMAVAGRPLARETLSRVLNGKQATSWATVEVLAELLDVGVRDLLDIEVRDLPAMDPSAGDRTDSPARVTIVALTSKSAR